MRCANQDKIAARLRAVGVTLAVLILPTLAHAAPDQGDTGSSKTAGTGGSGDQTQSFISPLGLGSGGSLSVAQNGTTVSASVEGQLSRAVQAQRIQTVRQPSIRLQMLEHQALKQRLAPGIRRFWRRTLVRIPVLVLISRRKFGASESQPFSRARRIARAQEISPQIVVLRQRPHQTPWRNRTRIKRRKT